MNATAGSGGRLKMRGAFCKEKKVKTKRNFGSCQCHCQRQSVPMRADGYGERGTRDGLKPLRV